MINLFNVGKKVAFSNTSIIPSFKEANNFIKKRL